MDNQIPFIVVTVKDKKSMMILIKNIKSYINLLKSISINDFLTYKSLKLINDIEMLLNEYAFEICNWYKEELEYDISLTKFEIEALKKMKKNLKKFNKNIDLVILNNLINALLVIEIIQKWKHEKSTEDNEEWKCNVKGISYMYPSEYEIIKDDIDNLKQYAIKLIPNCKSKIKQESR